MPLIDPLAIEDNLCHMVARGRRLWSDVTFATRHPGRRLAALTALGTISGVGEAAIVVLVVAIASGSVEGNVPFSGELPDGVWARAGLALAVLAIVAACRYVASELAARMAAESQELLRERLVAAFMATDWITQSRERTGVGSSRVDLQACKLEYSIVSPK